MLAVMEIPGCLVALWLVARLRRKGMDADGNAWDEPGYAGRAKAATAVASQHVTATRVRHATVGSGVGSGHGGGTAVAEDGGDTSYHEHDEEYDRQVELEREMSLEKMEHPDNEPSQHGALLSKELLHEVFLNPGIYLLFGGIAIGYISQLQGHAVTAPDDSLFVTLFQGILCLFLLEMGITASRRLRDLRTAGWRFILFGLLAPNLFAAIGITVAHLYSMALGTPFNPGNLRAVCRALWCGLVHCRAGGAATSHSRGQPHATACRFARSDLQLQRDHRHSGVHLDGTSRHHQFPGGRRLTLGRRPSSLGLGSPVAVQGKTRLARIATTWR